jgi:hypothetical protein
VENDADGDGLSNGAEALYGTDPLNPDTDGDGVYDGAEVLAETNPLASNLLVAVPSLGAPGLATAAALMLGLGLAEFARRRSRSSAPR